MEALSETARGILALWLLPGMGPKRIQALWDYFGTVESIFAASPKQLADVLGLSRTVTSGIPKALAADSLKKELALIDKHQVRVIDFTHSLYPSALKEIHNAPPILYLKGDDELQSGFYLAFVGSRKASFAGQNVCKKLIKNLAKLKPDTVVVSGLALGIDTAAHAAALDSGLRTVAVLANGLSDVYPARNLGLAESIQKNGSLVTEFPMAAKPVAGNFPLRNRIISGLAKGVVVVEAGERSGATITAGYAIEQNRELFALPGPADSSFYRGTNRLIQRSQAKLVMDADDILEEFYTYNQQLTYDDSENLNQTSGNQLSVDESKVLQLIREGINQKDRLLDHSDLPVQKLLSILTSLDIKGLIVSKPGAIYDIIQP